jgi:hypothetical protein
MMINVRNAAAVSKRYALGNPHTWDDFPRIHFILKLDEAKSAHQLDLVDFDRV